MSAAGSILALDPDAVAVVDFWASLASHMLRLDGSSVNGSGLASPPASHSCELCSGTKWSALSVEEGYSLDPMISGYRSS